MAHVRASLLALLLLAPAAGADEPPKPGRGGAEEKPPEDVPDEKAKEAIERFRREFQGEDLDLRVEAVERVRRVVHPDVANLLMDLGFRGTDATIRAAALRGLGLQKTSYKSIGPKVAKFLSDAAEENRKLKARGTYGLRIDPKTGDADTTSPEGKAAMAAKRERGKMLAEAVKVLDMVGFRDREGVDVLREFLTDGNDDLVAYVIGMFGKWKEWRVLPDLLDLFEMYPKEDSFETGSVSVDTGSAGSEDQQAAKRKWMAKYGDPDRRRPRPPVVRALKQALLDITGEKFEDPGALRDYMKRPEVKRKYKAR